MTFSQLKALREMSYYNGDTGTELSFEESEFRYFEMIEAKVTKEKPWQYGIKTDESNDCPFDFFNETKGLEMSVTIKEMNTENEPSFSSNEALVKALNLSAMREEFRQDLQIEGAAVVEKCAGYTRSILNQMVDDTRQAIMGIAKPRILDVSVNGVQRKLSKPANKHLGRMIINHGLGIHTMLVGPAGCGKTIAAGQLAEATGKQFGSMCLSAGASETWLFGRQTGNGFIEGSFAKIYKEGGIYLLDEMDAADSNFLLAVNTALANGFMTNPMNGEVIHQHKDFVCIAGANTFGMGSNASYTGRNRLDGATLTRFVKIAVDYDADIEEAVCPDAELRAIMQNARKVIANERMDYIVSTRCLDYAYRQKAAGISQSEILASLTLGWPEELVKKSGIADAMESKPKRKAKGSSEFLPVQAGEIF